MTDIRMSAVRRIAPGEGLPMLAPADLLLVTSSAEIGLLTAPASAAMVVALGRSNPRAPIHFVSIGCAGVAASILDFVQSTTRVAHVLVIESPADLVQATLDAAGVGQHGDGFRAQDVAYLLTLTLWDTAHADAAAGLRVLHCSLLSRAAGLGGTARLAAQFVSLWADLRERHPGLRVVTFTNASEWSEHLFRLVESLARARGLGGCAEWLHSHESDLRHYMTARPLLDLEAHGCAAADGPLLLPCLGAGGRLGVVVLDGAVAQPEPAITFAPPDVLDLPVPPAGRLAPKELPRSVLYAQREYFGRSQFYFRWKLTHDQLALPPTHLPGTPA
jgi:hypothetical protein